ncbi:MAG: FUSC family protein [Propionibacterium sp.]|nr:FUSC family protein [Propionibacterium sp.]
MAGMNSVQEFFSIRPAQRDHIPAFRIALGVALPLLTLMVMGRLDLAIYAAFGAFTGIYARNESPRSRVLRQSLAGLMLTVSVTLGAILSWFTANEWLAMLVATVVSGVGAVIAVRFNLKPGGSIFFIFATAAVGSIPAGPPVWIATLVAFLSAGISVALGAGAHLIGERPLSEAVPLVTERFTHRELLGHGIRFTVAPLVAGTLGILSMTLVEDLSHPYWAMVAAVAPISPPHRKDRFLRGFHRMVGTTGGVIVTAFLLSFPTEPWQLVVWIILCQFLAEVYVGRNYSLALLFITPIALLMTQIAAPTDPAPLLLARTVETIIGALVGLAVVAYGFPSEYRPRLFHRLAEWLRARRR